MKKNFRTILIIIVWLAPVLALPLYFFAFVGAGMSVSSPNANIGELLLLGVAPILSLAACVILIRAKLTIRQILIMIVPVFLSLAELAFVVLLCTAG